MKGPVDSGYSQERRLQQEVADLYDRDAARLLRYAASFAENPECAQDAVQEAFLRYFVERRHGREIPNPEAWLYLVVRYYLLDRIRKRSTRAEIPDFDLDRVASTREDPEEMFDRLENDRQIASALSAREWQCLRLRSQGFNNQEISRALGVKLGTVGSLLSRADGKVAGLARDRRIYLFSNTRERYAI